MKVSTIKRIVIKCKFEHDISHDPNALEYYRKTGKCLFCEGVN